LLVVQEPEWLVDPEARRRIPDVQLWGLPMAIGGDFQMAVDTASYVRVVGEPVPMVRLSRFSTFCQP